MPTDMTESSRSAQEVFQAIQLGDLRRLMIEFPTFDYVNTVDTSVADTAPCFTAIHWAACLGHVEIVQWILSKGVGTALRDNPRLKGVLRCGVIGDNPTVIRLLLDAGADHNWVDATGFTALRYASFLAHENAELIISNFYCTKEIAAFSIPDGAGGQTTLPTELVKPLKHLINMINSHPIRVALEMPPMFFDGNNPEIIDIALKTMRDRKTQNNPKRYDMAMSYKFHVLSCVLNAIKNENPGPNDSTQTEQFITSISHRPLSLKFFGQTIETFPCKKKLLKIMRSYHMSCLRFPEDTAPDILEYSCGHVTYHPLSTPRCALCTEFGASRKCSYCGKLFYCDQKCELLNRPAHEDLCNQLIPFKDSTDPVFFILRDLQNTTESQEPERMMTKEVEKKPTRKWMSSCVLLNIILVIIILIFNIYII